MLTDANGKIWKPNLLFVAELFILVNQARRRLPANPFASAPREALFYDGDKFWLAWRVSEPPRRRHPLALSSATVS
jgi:hypothetical protein